MHIFEKLSEADVLESKQEMTNNDSKQSEEIRKIKIFEFNITKNQFVELIKFCSNTNIDYTMK